MSNATEQIGLSAEQRPLNVRHHGDQSANQRVMIIAGQHGDEPLSVQAVRRFLAVKLPKNVCVAALSDANPDGSHRGQRRNAQGIDLNRDHQRLSAPETQAIHAFARRWQPHLIIDVHTYPPRRKHLLAQNLVHASDVYIDIANNPTACAHAIWAAWLQNALSEWISRVRENEFRCNQYTIVTKQGRVRHSTPDVVDARNGLALCCGVPTVLLEGREATRCDEASASLRTVTALTTALKIVVESASETSQWKLHRNNAEHPLPIRARYVDSTKQCVSEFFDRRHTSVRRVRLPGTYSPTLKISRRIAPPAAYLIRNDCTALVELLRRHGIALQPTTGIEDADVRQFFITHVEPSLHPLRPPRRLASDMREFSPCGNNWLSLQVSPEHTRLLAVYLEPHSKYALARYAELGIAPIAGYAYPVLRVERAEQAARCSVH